MVNGLRRFLDIEYWTGGEMNIRAELIEPTYIAMGPEIQGHPTHAQTKMGVLGYQKAVEVFLQEVCVHLGLGTTGTETNDEQPAMPALRRERVNEHIDKLTLAHGSETAMVLSGTECPVPDRTCIVQITRAMLTIKPNDLFAGLVSFGGEVRLFPDIPANMVPEAVPMIQALWQEFNYNVTQIPMAVRVICVRPIEQVIVVEPIGPYPHRSPHLTDIGKVLFEWVVSPKAYLQRLGYEFPNILPGSSGGLMRDELPPDV